MNKFFFKIIAILLVFFSVSTYAFDIYGFIPWNLKQDKMLITSQKVVKEYLNQNGLKEIDVVYHNRMLTNDNVDRNKIQKIALESQKNPLVPISFDLEIGNRNKPETIIPKLLAVIDLYHAYGGKAPIGVYATLPQNTYGSSKLTEKRKLELIALNKQYEIIAEKVDFLSPVLYFYDGEDMNAWKKSVDFNLEQSKILAEKYDLKIYPYITNSFRMSDKSKITKGWTIQLLNQMQMNDVLTYLNQKGADGVIIWASSQVVMDNGVKPEINTRDQWFQGINSFKELNLK